MEGGRRDLISGTTLTLPGGTQKNHEIASHDTQPRSEPGTSRLGSTSARHSVATFVSTVFSHTFICGAYEYDVSVTLVLTGTFAALNCPLPPYALNNSRKDKLVLIICDTGKCY